MERIGSCGKIIILEEGNKIGGWGSELASIIYEKAFDMLEAPISRIGSLDIPIPASGPMESQTLPSVKETLEIIKLVYGYN